MQQTDAGRFRSESKGWIKGDQRKESFQFSVKTRGQHPVSVFSKNQRPTSSISFQLAVKILITEN
jgi:hypothetical protein